MTDGTRVNYATDVRRLGDREFETRVGDRDLGLASRVHRIADDKQYGEMLDTIVPSCVDVLVVMDALGELQVLLGRRQHEPQPDWWVFGGRMIHGESFAQAAARNMRRETGVDLDLRRLSRNPLGAFSLIWDTREQAPKYHGCHTLSLPMVYECDDPAEFGPQNARFNDEYCGTQWVPLAAVMASKDQYHPALVSICAAHWVNGCKLQ